MTKVFPKVSLLALAPLGFAMQAHAIEPSECGEIHNDILDHYMATGMPTGTFQEVHDVVLDHADALDFEFSAHVAGLWMEPADTVAYDAARADHADLLDHLEDIAMVYWTRMESTTEADILGELAALDAAAEASLSGDKLGLALCVGSIAASSTAYWYDRTEDWVVIGHGDEEPPPDDEEPSPGGGMGTYDPSDDVDGWDVLEADATGAAHGAASGFVYGLATPGPITAGAMIGGAVIGAATNSVWEGGEQKKNAEAAKAEEETDSETPPPDEEEEDDDDTVGDHDDGGDNGGGDVGGGS